MEMYIFCFKIQYFKCQVVYTFLTSESDQFDFLVKYICIGTITLIYGRRVICVHPRGLFH